MTFNSLGVSLFGAFPLVDTVVEDTSAPASLMDILQLAMDYRYILTPELMTALSGMTDFQRTTVLHQMNEVFETLVQGLGGKVSPMYRAFPNHVRDSDTQAWLAWVLRFFRIHPPHTGANFGADPVTGVQDEVYFESQDYDTAFSFPLTGHPGGNTRRNLRFIKLGDAAFFQGKLGAMLSNLTPFSDDEADFVRLSLENGLLEPGMLQKIRFREKLPLLWGAMPLGSYAEGCTSVTDALRLAVHLGGANPAPRPKAPAAGGKGARRPISVPGTVDLSLKRKPLFNLKKSQAKQVLGVLEAILERGTTDSNRDFLRHDEYWKRLAQHLRVQQFEARFPLSVASFDDLFAGKIRSWDYSYECADIFGKIAMGVTRPGIFVRRLAALHAEVADLGEISPERDALLGACAQVFPKVDVLKLLQMQVHASRTVLETARFHMLPSSKILVSEKPAPTPMPDVVRILDAHLRQRLDGLLPWTKDGSGLRGTFLPAGNRAASSADVRTARGDRVHLDFTDSDTIRLFLHWKNDCDVDLSAVFFRADLAPAGDCSYYRLDTPFATHSGDIRNGARGAAEYIDVDVGKARKAGIRFVMLNANVYCGGPFSTFPCHVGSMIRDGKAGRHFEVSTVENTIRLDSDKTNTVAALFDLDSGDMIFVDMSEHWEAGRNVASKAAELRQTLSYFIDYAKYRVTYADILRYAGSAGAERAATQADIREKSDEILAALAAA